jgi:hypothetical protein
MSRYAAVLVLITAAVSACAPQMRTTMIGQPRAPDTAAADILVFSARVPECPFEEIALVSARQGKNPGTDMDDLLTALRQRAHELGGHAVLGLTERPPTKAEGPSLSGTVIRFTGDCRR